MNAQLPPLKPPVEPTPAMSRTPFRKPTRHVMSTVNERFLHTPITIKTAVEDRSAPAQAASPQPSVPRVAPSPLCPRLSTESSNLRTPLAPSPLPPLKQQVHELGRRHR